MNNGNSVIITTNNAGGSEAGNILFDNGVTINKSAGASATLTLQAAAHIDFADVFITSSVAALNIVAQSDADSTNNDGFISSNGMNITTNGGDITLNGRSDINGTLNAGSGNITVFDAINNDNFGGIILNSTANLSGYDITLHSNVPGGSGGYGAQIRLNSGSQINASHSVTMNDESTVATGNGIVDYAGIVINLGSTINSPALTILSGTQIVYNGGIINVTPGNVSLSDGIFKIGSGAVWDTQDADFSFSGIGIVFDGTLDAGTGDVTLLDTSTSVYNGGMFLNNGSNIIGHDITIHFAGSGTSASDIVLDNGSQINASHNFVINDDTADFFTLGTSGTLLNTGAVINAANFSVLSSGTGINYRGATINTDPAHVSLSGGIFTIAAGKTWDTQGEDFVFNGIGADISGTLDAGAGDITILDAAPNIYNIGINLNNGSHVIGHDVTLHYTTTQTFTSDIALNSGSVIDASHSLILQDDTTAIDMGGTTGINLKSGATINTPDLTVQSSGAEIAYNGATITTDPADVTFTGGFLYIGTGATLDTQNEYFIYTGSGALIKGTLNAGTGDISILDTFYNYLNGGIIVDNGGNLIGHDITLHSNTGGFGAQIRLNSGSQINASNNVLLQDDSNLSTTGGFAGSAGYAGVILNSGATVNAVNMTAQTGGSPIDYNGATLNVSGNTLLKTIGTSLSPINFTVSGGANNLILQSDVLPTLSGGVVVTGTNSLTFRPYTAGDSIGISGGSGTLTFSEAFLNNFSASTMIFGDATSGTGDVIVDSWDLSGKTYNVELYGNDVTLQDTDATPGVDYAVKLGSGGLKAVAKDNGGDVGDLNINAALTKSVAGTSTIDFSADNDVTFAAGSNITASTGKVNINLTSDLNHATVSGGAISLTDDTFTANGGDMSFTALGASDITIANSSLLTSGTNNIDLIAGGAVSYTSPDSILLHTVHGASVLIGTTGTSKDITANGQITATLAGNSATLYTTGNFINGRGSDLFNMTASGRWLVYSTNPALNTRNGLMPSAIVIYGETYGSLPPVSVGPGNLFVFSDASSSAPVLTFTADDLTKYYGDPVPTLTYSVTGYVDTDTSADAFTGSVTLATSVTPSTAIGFYPNDITVTNNGLASKLGYHFAVADGDLTVTAAPPPPPPLASGGDGTNINYDNIIHETGNVTPMTPASNDEAEAIRIAAAEKEKRRT